MDQLRILAWLQSEDGHKGRNRPAPLSPLADKPKRVGHTDRDPEEVMALLARFGPQREPDPTEV